MSPIPGSPNNWAPPVPPPTFKGYQPIPNSGAPPSFAQVDNPAGWTDFMYQPKYNKQNKYEGHFTSAGATVVPEKDGKRCVNGWEFHYAGWEASEFAKSTYARNPSTPENLKPPERGPRLDVELLRKHGINEDTMNSPLHFYQLLLPICDPSKSGIENDGRMPFFSLVSSCTNIYAMGEKGWGGGYSHHFEPVTATDMVRFMGVPVRHGARGGTPSTLHYRWCKSDEDFDNLIADAMTLSRWRQIKSVFKLSNNLVEPKRGQPGYDPCNKYDLIYKVMVHNMNYFTSQADLDFGVDESTWGFMGYSGECGGRLKNKKVTKGEQLFVF